MNFLTFVSGFLLPRFYVSTLNLPMTVYCFFTPRTKIDFKQKESTEPSGLKVI
jgi:hypothetical protein